LLLAALLTARGALSQVKVGQVSGSPGSLTAASGVAFQAAGSLAYLSNPVSGLVQKFRLSSGEVIASLQLPAGLGPITLSFDERTLAVVGVTTQKIYLVNTADMTIKRELSTPGSGFNARTNVLIEQSSQGTIFVADPPRNGIEVWNGLDGSYVRLIPVGVNPTILTLMPNGKQFGSLSSGRQAGDLETVDVIDMQTLNVVETRTLGVDTEPFNNIQFTNDNRYLVTPAYNNNSLQILTLNSTGVLASRATGGRGPTKIQTSPNGRYLAVINSTSKNVTIMSLPEAFILRDIQIPDTEFAVDAKLAFSSDSRTLYIPSSSTGQVLAYDVESGIQKSKIAVGRGPLAVAVSSDGTTLTSLDVGSNELSIVALAPISLFVPHLTQTATDYSGIALANLATEGATIALMARDDQGALIPGTTNPRTLTLGAGRQTSLVAGQFFGFNPAATLSGWIEVYTLGKGVSALYLTGNIGQTQLDGFLAGSTTAKLLGFSRITDGVSAYGSSTQTEIVMVNPSEQTANITSRLYGNTLEGIGRLLSHVTRTIPAHGRIRARMPVLHPDVVYPLGQAYLEITSDVAIQAMEVVKIGDSIAMIPAKVRALPDTTFLAAQFATGGGGSLDTPIYTHVTLANPTDRPITVTMQVTDDAGKIIPAGSFPITRTLQPYEVLQGGADALFKFPDPLTDPNLNVGSLKITAEQNGLIGDVIFGDARDGRYLTGLSLAQPSIAKSGFEHFAEGRFGEPAKGLYTGIAILNPNREPTDVLVEVFSPENALLGKSEFRIDGGRRLSRTIGQIVPAITQQNGGTIRVTSPVPIYLFEVFGSAESDFLAAVPPAAIP
jgi:DNA-binding beta-propeller fold protein YncE